MGSIEKEVYDPSVKILLAALLILLLIISVYFILESNKTQERKIDFEEIEQIRKKSSYKYCGEGCDWDEDCIRRVCNKS